MGAVQKDAQVNRDGSRWLRLLTLITVLLPVIALMWWGLGRIEDLQRQEVGNTLQTVLKATRAGFVVWAEDLKVDTQLAANQDVMKRVASAQLQALDAGAPLSTPALSEFRRQLEPYAQAHGLVGFALVAADGTQLATRFDFTLGKSDLQSNDGRTLALAFAGHSVIGLPFRAQPALSELQLADPERLPMMTSAAPVHDEKGAVIAVLAFRLDPGRDFTAVAQQGRIGETGETYLFDRQGRLLTESRFDQHLRQIGLVPPNETGLLNIEIRDPGVDLTQGFISATPRAQQPLTQMAQRAIEGQAGVDVVGYRDYRGVPVVGAWSWSDELHLGIVTEIDRAEAYRPIEAVRALALSMFAVLVAGALFVSGVLYRRASAARAQGRVLEGYVHATQREHALASQVFERMMDRATRSHADLRVVLSSLTVFNGDAVFASKTPAGHLRVLIADVSGHGLSAALGTLSLSAIFYSATERGDAFVPTIQLMNQELAKTLPTNLFSVAVVMELDRTLGRLTLLNSGMPSVYVCGATGVREFCSENLPLGITPTYVPHISTVSVQTNDRILAMSDGVIERANAQGERFGQGRVGHLLATTPPDQAFDALRAAGARFSTVQSDDVTVVELVV